MKKLLIILLLSLCSNNDGNPSFGDDHMAAAKYWVGKVFRKIYDNELLHGKTVKKYADIARGKEISCTGSSSITLQQAGVISVGKIVGHTKACGQDIIKYYNHPDIHVAIKKAITNREHLLKGQCDIVRVMKPFTHCDEWLRQKGVAYVQDSNMCVSAGSDMVWSCNSTGKRYGKHGVDPLRRSGYAKNSPILFAIVPRTNGKSNVPPHTHFEHIPC